MSDKIYSEDIWKAAFKEFLKTVDPSYLSNHIQGVFGHGFYAAVDHYEARFKELLDKLPRDSVPEEHREWYERALERDYNHGGRPDGLEWKDV